MARVQLDGYRCERCNYEWFSRQPDPPKVCPNKKCKSPYWDKPRKTVTESEEQR